MKIAIIGIRGLPSSYSGLETIISELAPRFVQRGHEVTVYCRSPLFKERLPSYKGVQLRYLPSIEHKWFSTLSHTFLAAIDASIRRYDILFAMNVGNASFGIFPKLMGLPCVLNVDGIEWLRPKWNRLAKKVFYWSAKYAKYFWDILVTDAAEMQRIYREEFGANSVYIGYGANIEYSTNPEVVRQYGLEPGNYFLIASRLVPDNNADLIVEGFVKSGVDKILAIAGGANYKGNLVERKFHEKLKALANHKVKFLGHISDQLHVKELHCNCYAYVHGHQFGGINPALLKALAYGNCILALDTPFSREVLKDGEYGILYKKDPNDLASKLQQIVKDPELAQKFRDKARNRILERFTWDRIADEYLLLFEMLHQRKPKEEIFQKFQSLRVP